MTTKAKRSKAPKVPTCGKCGDAHPAPAPKCERYNGWANYETWAVALWINNEQSLQSEWHRTARTCFALAQKEWAADTKSGSGPWRHAPLTVRERAAITLCDHLKAWLEGDGYTADSFKHPGGCGILADLLNAALSEVVWYDIADSLLNDAGVV